MISSFLDFYLGSNIESISRTLFWLLYRYIWSSVFVKVIGSGIGEVLLGGHTKNPTYGQRRSSSNNSVFGRKINIKNRIFASTIKTLSTLMIIFMF